MLNFNFFGGGWMIFFWWFLLIALVVVVVRAMLNANQKNPMMRLQSISSSVDMPMGRSTRRSLKNGNKICLIKTTYYLFTKPMKKLTYLLFLSLISGALFAQNSIAQNSHNHQTNTEQFDDVPEEFQENLTKVVDAYLGGKDAFLKSDLEASRSEFEIFKNKLDEIGQHGLSGDGHWRETYNRLSEYATVLMNSDNIESARHAFRALSLELANAVKKFGVEGVVYHQYCPMALDSNGAAWLSRNEQIQNPYTQDAMRGCGEVIERMES